MYWNSRLINHQLIFWYISIISGWLRRAVNAIENRKKESSCWIERMEIKNCIPTSQFDKKVPLINRIFHFRTSHHLTIYFWIFHVSLSPPRISAVQSPTQSSTTALYDEVLSATSLIEVKASDGSELPKRMSRDVKSKKAEKESGTAWFTTHFLHTRSVIAHHRITAYQSFSCFIFCARVCQQTERDPKSFGSRETWPQLQQIPQGEG